MFDTPRPSLPRELLQGALALALPIAVVLVLRPMFQDDSPFFLALVILSIVPGAFLGLMHARGPMLGIAGLVVMISTPWPVLYGTGVQFLHPGHYLPPDSAPRTEWEQVAVFDGTDRASSSNSAAVTQLAIVPVVAPGWTAEQPVSQVAVQELEGLLPRNRPWPQPWAEEGGLVPLLPDARREARVRSMLDHAGLSVAPALVLGEWSEHPEATRWHAARIVLMTWAIAFAAWCAIVAMGRVKPF